MVRLLPPAQDGVEVRGHRRTTRSTSSSDPAAADFVGSVNGGNHVVPTVKFADGSTLTNPSANEVKAKLAALAG